MEMVIAIALSALLLTALLMVVSNVLGVWADQAEDPLFDRHVDGLRRALEECVSQTVDAAANVGATAATQANIATTGTGTTGSIATTGRVRTASAVFSVAPGDAGVERAPYLRITGSPAFLEGVTEPLGFVHAWLVHEDSDGLILYWQTDDERRENQDAAHRLLLSPWVESISYSAYSDTNEEWTTLDDADPDSVPSGAAIYMRVALSHRGQTREFTLTLTDTLPHNLSY